MVTRIGPKNGKPHRPYFREWREKTGKTQEQVAERIETSKATVSRMEAGKSQYNAGYVQALADALDVEPEQLFFDPARPSVDALLKNATPEQRRQVLAVVETMLRTGTGG